MRAIRILGENVMSKKGLVGLSRDSLRLCREEIRAVSAACSSCCGVFFLLRRVLPIAPCSSYANSFLSFVSFVSSNTHFPLIPQALEIHLSPPSYPILTHCTQGKDRSGLVVMLILFILGVPREVVRREYMLSGEGIFARKGGDREGVRRGMLEEVLYRELA